jgi:hypothetical protein
MFGLMFYFLPLSDIVFLVNAIRRANEVLQKLTCQRDGAILEKAEHQTPNVIQS